MALHPFFVRTRNAALQRLDNRVFDQLKKVRKERQLLQTVGFLQRCQPALSVAFLLKEHDHFRLLRDFSKFVEIRDWLIEAGIDVNAKGPLGQTILHHLCERDGGDIQPFLRAGADVNARDTNGDTPLLHAVRVTRKNPHDTTEGASLDNLSLLLEGGADPFVHDLHGNTALHFAAAFQNGSALQCLLELGVDPHACNSDARNARQLAEDNGLWAMVDIFDRVEAEKSRESLDGQLPKVRSFPLGKRL